MDWEAYATREMCRYADGAERLQDHDRDARQRQLVRMAMAAGGAGLARLMQGRRAEAETWLARSAERYRESYADAPLDSWGRLIGAVKARLLAGDSEAVAEDARWALEQGPAKSTSPIGRYAAALAALALGDNHDAGLLAAALREEESFPAPVADALAALASCDETAYADAVGRVLASFASRDAFLEDVPVADTVLALEALAEGRGISVHTRSPLLPAP